MAPVIWGLNLKDITWAKFGNKNMWSDRWHLRRLKIVFYQLAMIFCVVSESLGTAALTDYLDQSEFIHQLDNNALEYNQDYVGVGSYNIFAGVFVAFIFGAAFFFDLIWPERHESKGVRTAWRICAILAVLIEGGSAFALTIITATGAASVSGVESDRATYLLKHAKYSPLRYRDNHRAIAAVVFIWPGWICVIVSCVLLWLSMANEDRYGTTLAAHNRHEKTVSTTVMGSGEDYEKELGERPAGIPVPAPAQPRGSGEQPLVARTDPSFEAETTAAIDGVRRSPKDDMSAVPRSNLVGQTSELAGSVPATTDGHVPVHAGRSELSIN